MTWKWLKPLTECPRCQSRDYEYYSVNNLRKRTNYIEHRCLKCGCKWGYKKGDPVIIE